MIVQTPRSGPFIRAVDPWLPGNPGPGARHQLLSADEQAQIARISSIVRFKKGDQIYLQGDRAAAAFNILSGVVTAHGYLADDHEHISAFLYPGDIFGLSEEGRYTNSARATTAVVAYKMPLQALQRLLKGNAQIDVGVIVKLCEELRQAQRHALLLDQKKAITRVAMFLDLQEHLQLARGESASEIHLPMARSDIAAYLGLTLAAVSRTFRDLIARRVISVRDRHHLKIVDRRAFKKIADNK